MTRSPTLDTATASATAPRSFPFLITRQRHNQGYEEVLMEQDTPPAPSAELANPPATVDIPGANRSAEASFQPAVIRNEPADAEIPGVIITVQASIAHGNSLTMLWIPPGRFWMGSPANESGRTEAEGPQHLVQVQGFFMASAPITQPQWQAVARWHPIDAEAPWQHNLDASLDGSDKNRVVSTPVTNVTWFDAMEFCRRLSQRTGRFYTLPSEAQWEYACRAGTVSPFHFGDRITTDLANYNGAFTSNNGPKGLFRGRVSDVSSAPQPSPMATSFANDWGLQSMHGNQWEWCADHWHDHYRGAPQDDQPWCDAAANADAPRVRRGGSWNSTPAQCRSASRQAAQPNSTGSDVGFRVCCLPHVPVPRS